MREFWSNLIRLLKQPALLFFQEVFRSVDQETLNNREYLQKFVVPTLMKGLSELYSTRPQSPIEWLADWLSENNPNKT